MGRSLSSLGIRTKLFAGLVVLSLLAAGLGAVMIERMSQLSSSAKVVTNNYFPSVVAATELRGLLYKLRIAELDYVSQSEGAGRNKVHGINAGLVAKYVSQRAAFDRLIDPGEETELYATLDAAWAQYLPMHDKLMGLGAQGDLKDMVAWSGGPMDETFGKLTRAIDLDVAYNVKAGEKASTSFEDIYASTWVAVWSAIAAVAVSTVFVGTVLAQQISSPLVKITAAMRKLADHDLSTTIPGVGRGDEIGSMAAAVNVFKDSMVASAALTKEQERSKAEAAASQRAAMHELANAFESKVGGLIAMVSAGATELQATADSMSSTAQQTRQQASTAAEATTETCAGVQTVATAAEQLSTSIQEIGRQVTQSSEISGKAVADARRTDATVRALAEGAQKIGDVVGLIADIASQTNLLALNATIEAARAGDAGKGFAVVASEVKSLASQTARATQDISAQISGIQSASAEAVQAIKAIGATIDQVNGIAVTISSAVEEQGAATGEIARSVQLTAKTTLAATGNIESVAQAANDTGAAAAQVLGASNTLSMQAEQLNAAISEFVAEVRAA